MHALPRRLVAVVAALLLTVLATVVTGFRGGVPDRMGVWRGMRNALGMGLRTMSSIAWFPLAILLFQLTESVILARDAVRMRLSRGKSPHQLEPLALVASPIPGSPARAAGRWVGSPWGDYRRRGR